jgi:hypothetical protein
MRRRPGRGCEDAAAPRKEAEDAAGNAAVRWEAGKYRRCVGEAVGDAVVRDATADRADDTMVPYSYSGGLGG